MKRSELVFSAFCAASGLMAVLAVLGRVNIAGTLPMGFYPLYSLAAVAGWIGGNLYLRRSKGPLASRRSLLLAIYLFGPAGPLSLLRAMADVESLVRAPAVPLFAFGVYVVLFLVPVSLRSRVPVRSTIAFGENEDDQP